MHKIFYIGMGMPNVTNMRYGEFLFLQAKEIQNESKKEFDVTHVSVDVRSLRHHRHWGVKLYDKDGIHVIESSLPLGRIPGTIRLFVQRIMIDHVFRLYINKYGFPDLLHAHFTDAGYLAACLKQKYGVPFVLTEHSSGINRDELDCWTKRIANIAYNSADRIIAVSPALQNRIKQHFSISSIYIPNMVNPDVFFYKEQSTQNVFSFIAVGGLLKSKRLDFLIDCFIKEFQLDEPVTLQIIGSGPEEKILHNAISTANRESQMFLLGEMPNYDVADYLRNSGCFVLPSLGETFGVVYAEAIMCGCPVIATRCGGPESIVNRNNGVLVDVDDGEALQRAMRKMYTDVDKYDRHLIASEAKDKYAYKGVAGKIGEVYRSVLL